MFSFIEFVFFWNNYFPNTHIHTCTHSNVLCLWMCDISTRIAIAIICVIFIISIWFFSSIITCVCMCGWYDDCLCMLFCPLISLFDDFFFTIIHQSSWLCMYYTCIFFFWFWCVTDWLKWKFWPLFPAYDGNNNKNWSRIPMLSLIHEEKKSEVCESEKRKKKLLSSSLTTTNKTRYKKKQINK